MKYLIGRGRRMDLIPLLCRDRSDSSATLALIHPGEGLTTTGL